MLYGREGVTDQEVRDAIEKANAKHFIDGLPKVDILYLHKPTCESSVTPSVIPLISSFPLNVTYSK